MKKELKNTAPDTLGDIPFEDAMSQLEGILENLENGSLSLKESVEEYAKATKLHTHCAKVLAEAELKIEEISGKNIEHLK